MVHISGDYRKKIVSNLIERKVRRPSVFTLLQCGMDGLSLFPRAADKVSAVLNFTVFCLASQ